MNIILGAFNYNIFQIRFTERCFIVIVLRNVVLLYSELYNLCVVEKVDIIALIINNIVYKYTDFLDRLTGALVQ